MVVSSIGAGCFRSGGFRWRHGIRPPVGPAESRPQPGGCTVHFQRNGKGRELTFFLNWICIPPGPLNTEMGNRPGGGKTTMVYFCNSL